MIRGVFTFASILTLILCAATVALWVRSYFVLDILAREHTWLVAKHSEWHASGFSFESVRGRLEARHDNAYWEYSYLKADQVYGPVWVWSAVDPAGAAPRGGSKWRRIGLFYEHSQDLQSNSRTVGTPHWFLASLALLLPLWHVHGLFRAPIANKRGRCPRCGYDLRATPDRCPECGMPVPKKAQATS